MNKRTVMMIAAMPLALAGCFTVKTESEVKPIHITLDVNVKVDKELDRSFADEDLSKPKGQFAELKSLLDRQVAGVNSQALFEARPGASDDDRILIAEENARRLRRFNEIAKSSGVKLEAVQARSRKRFEAKIPAGSGVWLQRENGEWHQQ